MRRTVPLVLIFILLCAPFAAAGERPVAATVDEGGLQRVEVLAGSYFFRPSHIIVKVNVPVVITIKKEPSIVPHNFVMRDGGLDIKIKLSTEAREVRFTPGETGTFDFWCDRRFLFFKSHRARGMEGVLEVIE